jgi:hypothetical protein
MPALTARRSIGIEKEVCEPFGAVWAWVDAKAREAWPAREVEVKVVVEAVSGCGEDDKVAGLDRLSTDTKSAHCTVS